VTAALVHAGAVASPSAQPSCTASTAGNLLACVLTYSSSGPPAVTSANWARAVTVSSNGATAEIWYLAGTYNAGGITAAAVSNWSAAGNYGDGAQLLEFSGIAATSPLDQTGTNTSGSPSVSTSGAITANDELAIAVTFLLNNPNAIVTLTSGAGFTSSGNLANGTNTAWAVTPADSYACLYDYQLDTGGSSSGTVISDAVSTAGTWINAQVIATFKLAAGGTSASAGLATGTGTGQPVTGPDLFAVNYAGAAAGLGGGSGSWSNTGNADGAPDAVYATWAVP